MRKIITPFSVGLLVLVVGTSFAVVYAFVNKAGLNDRNSIPVVAIFKDATGLEKKSSVQIAGIRVGEITDIGLYKGSLAQVRLRIRKDVHLHTDAAVTKRSTSLLGDMMLDIYPGSPDAPDMPPGGQITIVHDANNVQEIFDSLQRITHQIEDVTKGLSGTLNGEKGSISTIVESLQKTVTTGGETLTEVLNNMRDLTATLNTSVGEQRQSFQEIIENVRIASGEAARALNRVDQILGANETEVKQNVHSIQEALDKINTTLAGAQQIVDKINNGQGTLGKLINDEQMANKLEQTVDDASDLVSRINRIQLKFAMYANYMFAEGAAQGFLDLKIQTNPDRYYLFQLVSDTRATYNQVYVQYNPPVPGYQTNQVVETASRSLKFSAEFAQAWYQLTLRVGLIQNTIGAGLDYDIYKHDLTVSLDAFDFSDEFQPYPRLRGYLTYRFLRHIQIQGGMDDILNKPAHYNTVAPMSRGATLGGREFFLGAGVYFTDDDLRTMVGLAGTATTVR
jgi:phospholipid/cholesterol/gamma-HCH transport system substrate-binding protein